MLEFSPRGHIIKNVQGKTKKETQAICEHLGMSNPVEIRLIFVVDRGTPEAKALYAVAIGKTNLYIKTPTE